MPSNCGVGVELYDYPERVGCVKWWNSKGSRGKAQFIRSGTQKPEQLDWTHEYHLLRTIEKWNEEQSWRVFETLQGTTSVLANN